MASGITHVTVGIEMEQSEYEALTSHAIGTILPDAADTYDLGSTSYEFKSLYLGDSGRLYFGLSQLFNIRTVSNHLEISDASIVRVRLRDNGEVELKNSTASDGSAIPQLNLYNYKGGEVSLRMNRAVDDTGSGAMTGNPWVFHIPPSLVAGDFHLNITRDGLGNYMAFDSAGNVSIGYDIGNTENGLARFCVNGGADESQAVFRGFSTQTNPILDVRKSDDTKLFEVFNTETKLGQKINVNSQLLTEVGEIYGDSASFINTKNEDAAQITFRARDTGNTIVKVGIMQGAADPYFGLGGSAELIVTNAGLIGFFAATPIGQVVDARIDDAINSGDATTDGVIDALRDAMISYGLIAAA